MIASVVVIEMKRRATEILEANQIVDVGWTSKRGALVILVDLETANQSASMHYASWNSGMRDPVVLYGFCAEG